MVITDKSATRDEMAGFTRREVFRMAAVASTAGGISLATPSIVRAQGYDKDKVKFAFSTPFSGQDSFTGTIGGLKKGVEIYGGELSISDASFDLKKQNDQIAAIVASRPDVFIVLPVDPVGCANAIDGAVEAGIPTFVLDTVVPGVAANQFSFHDNFGMGQVNARWMAERLGGKGKIGALQLELNETWNQRDMGMEFALRDFPEIEVVATWTLDPTGKVTPRAAADSFLTAHPDISAIWAAWDNAAMEAALAALAAGRPDVFTVGIDGGPAAFENIRSGGPFKFTCTQSFYSQAIVPVLYAHELLQGRRIPRTVLHPSFAVSAAELEGRGDLVNRWDEPGVPEQLGWKRVL